MNWLPYGSNDASVLLQHSLTSDPSTYFATKATVLTYGSTPLFDSVKGFCPNTSNGWRLTNLTGYLNLDYAGQISLEIEREFICQNDTTYYSQGYIPTAQEYILSCSPTAGSAINLGSKTTAGLFFASIGGAAPNQAIFSPGKPGFIKVNIGWWGGIVGGKVVVAIDDQVIYTGSRNLSTLVGMFANFYIGGDRGVAGRFMTKNYIRNLQISNKSPVYRFHSLVGTVALLSDSTANGDDVVSGNYKDVSAGWSFRRRMSKYGIDVGQMTVSVNGGYRLDNSLPGSYLYDKLAALLALNPQTVIIFGGTNDAAAQTPTSSGWQAQVTTYLTGCFATPSVKLVIIAGPMSMTYGGYAYTTYGPQITAANTKIRAAISAWNISYPSQPAVFADRFNYLGGESPAAGTFIGQVDGLNDNLHPCGYGHYLQGLCISDAITGYL